MDMNMNTDERSIQETPRKLYTREMTLSPSPLKQRIFPESPDLPDYQSESDESENDEAVFDMSKGVADLRDCDRLIERAQRAKGMKRMLRHRPSLPDFNSYGVEPLIQTEDKENRDPAENMGKFRLRGRYYEPLPHRDPTVIHIPSSRPDITRMRSEEPYSSRCETLGAPLSPSPKDSFVLPKREGTRASVSPVKGQASRIPIKTAHSLDEYSGNTAISPKRGMENEINGTGIVEPSSSMVRMNKICQTLSTPQTPPDSRAKILGKGIDSDTRHLGKLKFDSEPIKSHKPAFSSALSTPTKREKAPASASRAFPNNDVHMLNKKGTSSGLKAGTGPGTPQRRNVKEAIPTWSFEHAMSEAEISITKNIAIDGESSEHPDSDESDVVDYYTSTDAEEYSDDGRFFGEGNITLPSPSTSSQRSMPWFSADGLTTSKQVYPEPEFDTPAEMIMPRLEVVDGVLMLVSPKDVVQCELLCEVTVQLYLKNRNAAKNQSYRINWPQTESRVPIGFKWQRKFTRGRSVSCIPQFLVTSPTEEVVDSPDDEAGLGNYTEYVRQAGTKDFIIVEECGGAQSPIGCGIVATAGECIEAADDTMENATERVMVEHLMRSLGEFRRWVSSFRVKIRRLSITKDDRRRAPNTRTASQFLQCLGLMCIVISAYMAGSMHSYSPEADKRHELSGPVRWMKDGVVASNFSSIGIQAPFCTAETETCEEDGDSTRKIKGIGVVIRDTNAAPPRGDGGLAPKVDISSSMIPNPKIGDTGLVKTAEKEAKEDGGREEAHVAEGNITGGDDKKEATVTAAGQGSLRDRLDRFLGWREPSG